MKLIIVGGVAGGASAAARARRLSEDAEILLIERGPDVSFANCGLPYHIGEVIPQRDKLLVTTPERLRERFRLDVRTRTEVEAIDRHGKTVRVRDLTTGRVYEEGYDKLILAPGAAPIRPPITGADLPNAFIGFRRRLPGTPARHEGAGRHGQADAPRGDRHVTVAVGCRLVGCRPRRPGAAIQPSQAGRRRATPNGQARRPGRLVHLTPEP